MGSEVGSNPFPSHCKKLASSQTGHFRATLASLIGGVFPNCSAFCGSKSGETEPNLATISGTNQTFLEVLGLTNFFGHEVECGESIVCRAVWRRRGEFDTGVTGNLPSLPTSTSLTVPAVGVNNLRGCNATRGIRLTGPAAINFFVFYVWLVWLSVIWFVVRAAMHAGVACRTKRDQVFL